MADNDLFPVHRDVALHAWVSDGKYKAMYAASIADPDKFWGE